MEERKVHLPSRSREKSYQAKFNQQVDGKQQGSLRPELLHSFHPLPILRATDTMVFHTDTETFLEWKRRQLRTEMGRDLALEPCPGPHMQDEAN